MKPKQGLKKRRAKKLERSVVSYDSLEPRHLLATDVGLAFTGSTYVTDSSHYPPDANGDVGRDHMVEVLNGRINMIGRDDGVRVKSQTMTDFFTDAGALLDNEPINPKVVFDRLSDRWFVAANGTNNGNWVYLAISATSDPTGAWDQVQFVGDSTATQFNDQVTLSVDADAVYMTTNNTGPFGGPTVSIYTIPKVDLLSDDVTLTDMSRFEDLDPEQFGSSIQVARNFEASDGQAIAVGTNGVEGVILTTITDAGTTTAALGTPVEVTTDLLGEYSDVTPAQQPIDPVTEDELFLETSSELTSGVVEVGGSVWGIKTAGLTESEGVNVLNWFEIDATVGDTFGEVIQSETLPNGGEDQHIFNPSLSVNQFGVVAIGYNFSGVGTPVGFYTRVGITVNGLGDRATQLEGQFQMEPGLQVHRAQGDVDFVSPWGASTSVQNDPDSVNSFFSVGPWANTVDRWTTHNAIFTPQELRPVVSGDGLDNTIVLRRNAANNELLEIEFDGTVTDLMPYEVLGQVEIRALGGDDRFVLDYSNGNPIPSGGFLLDGGGGIDTIETNNADENFWTVGEDETSPVGSGTYNTDTEFLQVEELVGGFSVDNFLVQGQLLGSLDGRAGDDVFEFSGTGSIGDSVIGGEGFNTVSLLNRMNAADPPDTPAPLPSEFFLLGTSASFDGFDGETPDGPIGGDDDTDQFQDISRLIGSQTELDTLHGLDLATILTLDGASTTYEADGRTLSLDQFDAYHTSSQDDSFFVKSNALDQLRLFGLAGDDQYHFSSDAPLNEGTTDLIGGLVFAFGGAGANTLDVSNVAGSGSDVTVLSKRISGMGEIVFDAQNDGGTFALTLTGSNESDNFLLHSFIDVNTMSIHAMDGNDSFDVQDLSKAPVDVFGGAGDDLYVIESINGVKLRNLVIHDSVDDERDRVSLRGTVLDEVFEINNLTFVDTGEGVAYTGIEEFGALGRAGNDTFNITEFNAPLFIDGESGDDVVNISSDAPTNNGTVDTFTHDLHIDGGTGVNQLNISNRAGAAKTTVTITNNSITGLLPVTLHYQAAGQFSNSDGSVGGINLQGSDEIDLYNLVSLDARHSMRFEGHAGNDRFYVRENVLGNVAAVGGEGNDIYRAFFVGDDVRRFEIEDPSGNNRLSVYGTANDDTIQISNSSVDLGGETVALNATLAYMETFGGAGNDSMTLDGTAARTNYMFGEAGDDAFHIDSSEGAVGLRMVGNAGMDDFHLNQVNPGTYSRVLGGLDNDSITVLSTALGPVSSDGSEGSDSYTAHFVGSGSRWFGALDTGSEGTDTVTTFGTAAADDLIVRVANVYENNERIAFGSNTEVLNVDGVGGADQMIISASFADTTNLYGGEDADHLDIVGTTHIENLSAMMGQGGDTVIIRKVSDGATLTVDGQDGDDMFVVGSYTVANLGNLGRIRGGLNIVGGDSDSGDRLLVNDGALSANFSYLVTDQHILNDSEPGGLERAEFAGIYFDNTLEHVQLDGTQGANHFLVAGSQTTQFLMNGNSPTPDNDSGDEIALADQADDGREFEWLDEEMGEGRWTFVNGNLDVEFKDMESVDHGDG